MFTFAGDDSESPGLPGSARGGSGKIAIICVVVLILVVGLAGGAFFIWRTW